MTEIDNEKEWRRFLMSEVKDIKDSQDSIMEMIHMSNISISNLKLKMGMLSATIGLFAGVIASWITSKL